MFMFMIILQFLFKIELVIYCYNLCYVLFFIILLFSILTQSKHVLQ